MRRLKENLQSTVTMPRRRGDAAKVIIITVCAFAMIMLLLCVGSGIYVYVLFQRNFARAMVVASSDIHKIAGEITDIDIPPQFTPVMGSAIFTMKTVNYAWNPEGKSMTAENWNESRGPLLPMLHIMEMGTDASLLTEKDFEINAYQKKALKSQYTEFTESVQEFTIRGRKCQFLFVTGRPKEGAFDNEELLFDEADEAAMMEEEKATAETTPTVKEDKPADATAPTETPAATPAEGVPVESPKPAAPEAPPLPAVRTVTGKFPGKSGPTTIEIRVPVEGSDDELLLKIIQSIK